VLLSRVRTAGGLVGLVDRHPGVVAAGIGVATWLFIQLDFARYFVANDDVAMLEIANGRLFGHPSEHLVFINVALGFLLRELYIVLPSLPWYAILLQLLDVVAVAVIVYLALARSADRRWLVGAVLLDLVAFQLTFLIGLTFTSVALLLAGAGCLLFVFAPAAQERPSVITGAIAGSCVGLAVLLRLASAQAILLALAPLLVWAAVRSRPRSRLVAFVSVLALVGGGGLLAERLYLGSDPGWEHYRQYNLARGALHDTDRLVLDHQLRPVLARIGWSANDLQAFKDWLFADEHVYSLPKLRAIDHATSLDIDQPLTTLLRTRLWDPYQVDWLALALVAAISLVLASVRRRWLMLATTATFLGVLAYLAVFVRLPTRVGAPLLCVLAVALVLLAATDARERVDPQRWQLGPLVLCCVLAVFAVASLRDAARTDPQVAPSQVRLTSLYDQMYGIDPSGTYIAAGATLPYQDLPLFTESRDLPPADVILLGWDTNSPDFQAKLTRARIPNIYAAVAGGGHVYLVTNPVNFTRGVFESFVAQHYGWHGRLRLGADFGDGTVAQSGLYDYSIDPFHAQLHERLDGRPVGQYSIVQQPRGRVEGWATVSGERYIAGWAADPTTAEAPTTVVLMVDGSPLAVSQPTIARSDIVGDAATRFGVRNGFQLMLPAALPRTVRDVRIFALFGNRAVELPVSPSVLPALQP
jgi:hypothetical protein